MKLTLSLSLEYEFSCASLSSIFVIDRAHLELEHNNGGKLRSRPRLFYLLKLLISKNFKSYASLTFEQAQAKTADLLPYDE